MVSQALFKQELQRKHFHAAFNLEPPIEALKPHEACSPSNPIEWPFN